MKNLFKQNGAVITIAMIAVIGFTFAALSLTGCDDGGSGGPETLTYKGKDAASGDTYTLTIAKTAPRAFTPIAGDQYKLTDGTDESRGTVDSFTNNNFTLQPSNEGAQKFYATVSGNDLTGFSGTITLKDGTKVTAPATLTPVTPVKPPSGDNTWTLVADTKLDSISAIAYGGGKFVAVGGRKMAYSSDGKTWTAVADSTFGTDRIDAIAYGGGKFVAGGEKGKAAYSSDGITWTAVTSDAFNLPFYGKYDIEAIAYGGGKFVAGGGNGRMAYSSDDGATWTAVEDTKFISSIYAIAYGNGTFVAVGGSDHIYPEAAYSPDGINWTAVKDTRFSYEIRAVAYGGSAGQERFVAVGGSNNMAYSSNGVTWTEAGNTIFSGTGSSGAHDINAIAYGNGTFVAGGYGGITACSPDGINWTGIPRTVNSAFFKETQSSGSYSWDVYYEIKAIVYGNSTFAAGCEYGKMAYSTVLNGSSGSQEMRPVIASSGILPAGIVGTAYNQTLAASGSTPITWTLETGSSLPPGLSLSSSGVISGTPTTPGTVFDFKIKATNSVGSDSMTFLMRIDSGGGITWTDVTECPLTSNVMAIAYGGGTFVAGDYSGKMAYSSNGIKWILANSPFVTGTASYVNAIAYGGGTFVAVDYYGGIAYSSDGITWTAVAYDDKPFGYYDTINTVAYGGPAGQEKFVAGSGNTGTIAYSTDGKKWTAVKDSTFGTSGIYAIAWGNNKFVAGGGSGKIATSPDGVTWTAGTISGSIGQTAAIAFGGNKFVIVGYDDGDTTGNTPIAYSTDGVTWTGVTTDTGYIKAVAYGNGMFIALDGLSTMLTSSDGISWTKTNLYKAGNISYCSVIAFGDGKFVAGGTYIDNNFKKISVMAYSTGN
jgi:hypothetical protein